MFMKNATTKQMTKAEAAHLERCLRHYAKFMAQGRPSEAEKVIDRARRAGIDPKAVRP